MKQRVAVFAEHASLWLVRHGQTDWNLAGRWQGQSPHAPDINETGRAQALTVRAHLKNKRFSAIYASDLLRAHQTAQLIAESLGLQVTLEPRLREMDLGHWEGMLHQEIEARYPRELSARDRDPWNTPAPGGESPKQVAKRVISAVDEIAARHCSNPVLIVAHGISLAIILCQARGIPLERLYGHVPDNAELYRVEWDFPVYACEFMQEEFSMV